MARQCRWGILGTAGIARKNWKAIRLSGNACVSAVASRSIDAADRFIDECSCQVPVNDRPHAFGSYEDLLASSEVDAVYIPLPTALRKQWVVRAAEAGKHVLGEKPAASNAVDVAEMLAACERNAVQYMDGVMFMHSKRLPMLRQMIASGNPIGKLRRMCSQFSFAGDETFQSSNIRVHSELEPYGCLGDLGWYCVRFFLWVLEGTMPVAVRARTLSTLQGSASPGTVPGELSAELVFPGGVSANFYCSFMTENQQWMHLSGTQGSVRIDDFVLPYHGPEVGATGIQDVFHVANTTFHMEHHASRHAVSEYSDGEYNSQEVNMIREFSDLVVSGQVNEQWPAWTLKTQRVLDACFESARHNGQEVVLN
ncbi:MAG: Gfo/Idh/MocA family oxidoreductase [Planctomycetales bacterium]|nr:Gfo/Idh/MocA family oxidoreductase [Planctomycetales bacterium]